MLPAQRERLADTEATPGEDLEQDATEAGSALEERDPLLWLDPRPRRLRRLQPTAASGRRVRRDELVLDGRLEDLREVAERVVDACVRESAFAEPLAARVCLLPSLVDRGPLDPRLLAGTTLCSAGQGRIFGGGDGAHGEATKLFPFQCQT